MKEPNKPDPANPAMALRLAIVDYRRRVADLGRCEERMKIPEIPRHIWYFLFAFFGTVLVSLLDFAAQLAGLSRQDLGIATFGNFVIGTVITLIFVWFILYQKNWARIVYTVLILLSVPIAVLAIGREIRGDLIGAISSSTQLMLNLVSILFLFTRQSRDWFKASQQIAQADRKG